MSRGRTSKGLGRGPAANCAFGTSGWLSEGNAQTDLDDPRVIRRCARSTQCCRIELAVQHAEVSRILKAVTASVPRAIGPLHMIRHVERLKEKLRADSLGEPGV